MNPTKRISAVTGVAVLLAFFTLSAAAADRKPIPTPSDPKMMTFNELRDVQYCEVWLFGGTPESGISGTYFNTGNLNNSEDKMDTCPPAIWDKLTVPSLEASYEVLGAYKNGPRGFTFDKVVIPVGPVEDFQGLQARWWGAGRLPKGMDLKVAHMTPYEELKSHRKSTFTFKKGQPLFILEDPEGTPWVMQAYSKILDPNLSYESLKDLGSKLKPPSGWKYRVATLDQDLIISTPQGYNWIVQDELQNTYDACKEGACNVQP